MRLPVLILDFGSQFTQLIARRVRELGVYCEIEPFSISSEKLKQKNPEAIILSGGPSTVGLKKSPKLESEILAMDVPILGICYGMQLLSHAYAGKLIAQKSREYGRAEIEIIEPVGLFNGFKKGQKLNVWMSHGDSVSDGPTGSTVTARGAGCLAALERDNLHAVQFHPEVFHTEKGSEIFSNFLFHISKLKPTWKISNFLEEKTEAIKALVGDSEVVGGISGGVDSTILAVFLGKILGKKFHPILVDTGLLRENEAVEVKSFLKKIGVDLKVISAEKLFLDELKKVSDPEKKRKIIGKNFIKIFETECKRYKNAKFLAQGTLYPDVIESVSVKGPSHTIKTHHNVGGLPKNMKLKLVEPFRELFKDEVRELGKQLNIPETLILRHPFPGPGLAVRHLGKLEKDSLALLRKADTIFMDALQKEGLYNQIWQAFCVYLPVRSVGVMGDGRTYENVIALRAVTSRDGMTADWYGFEKDFLAKVSNRIINEVKGINRVVYDISSKPPATIEWE